MPEHRYLFVGGLHKSGTSLVASSIATHPKISGFRNTGVPENEGQHLQSVFPPASAYGGPGKFGFDPDARLLETSPLVSEENRVRLLVEWGAHWDLTKDILLEKSPPNMIRTRFLQALFPESYFLIVMRDPIAVAYATRKWSHTTIQSLIEHWLVCHEIFELDRPFLRRVHVVRYEDFVEGPQAILDDVCSFLEVEPIPCGVEVRPDVNATYLQKWMDDSSTSDEAGTHAMPLDYNSRVAAFGYSLSLSG
jgi:hypothetical protein